MPHPTPLVHSLFDPATSTYTHIVYDHEQGHAAIVDSVLDYDHKSGRTHHAHSDTVIAFVRQHGLTVDWILETHAHADHLSDAPYLKAALGGRIAIGQHIHRVQHVFKKLFHLEAGFATDGSQFDHLFADGETFSIGTLTAQAWHVPGHTPADMAFVVGDAVFVGDTLFMPDVGTARCDFPGGDAHQLYRSVQRLLDLPGDTRLYLCHDYPPEGRKPQAMTTVRAQREANIHVRDGIGEDDFVARRRARDATLEMPVLILPSVQVNIRAGHLPPPEADGRRYLKIPVDAL
ncbi:MBL fold metallo-hydrolase [uncultured Aquabacterium sp.]|jgi:glyoxylase-like metal-dependent hydrolase (beta-lactamase superfamily II)|uniref:MBL fold metallo-hydrolase n=1 Tax=uncultured Aquabacterium sp. TaxID=158753 RepID=UPI0026149D7F|nr:MBL fold metallo-hydrolase [uncultured Aquabacterium sp.]